MIRQLHDGSAFVLETAHSAYCIAVVPNPEEFAPSTHVSAAEQNEQSGAHAVTLPTPSSDESSTHHLVHLYWGKRLPRLDDYVQILQFPERSSFDATPLLWPLEYRPWSGRMYQEPSLKVCFSDGTRDVAWRFVRAEMTTSDSKSHVLSGPHEAETLDNQVVGVTNNLVLHFSDPLGLAIRLYYRVLYEEDTIVRFVEVQNVSGDVVQLTNFHAATWNLPELEQYRATTVRGDWGREFQVQRDMVRAGKVVLESRKGHTSHDENPFFMVDNGFAQEHRGEVWFGALAWSGNWKLAIETSAHRRLSVSGGYNDFDFIHVLRPREIAASPHFVAGYTAEGFGGASRLLHRYAHRVQTEFRTRERPVPVLYNSWEATYFDVNEADQKKLAEIAAELGVDLFVVDDGWFGERNSDLAGLGDWFVNSKKFPNGLNGLIEHVERLGMKFGIWVEPEMVNPDSQLYREHPDWVLHFPGRKRTLSRHQAVLDFSNQAVRDYVFRFLDELLTNHRIRYVKWDMNRPITEPGSPNLPPESQMEVWTRHVEGLYEVLQKIHDKHPGVVIESCSGGGGRVDFAMLQFASQFWTSDNTDAYDRLRIQEGFTYAYPAATMRAWVTDSVQFMNARKVPLAFRFHSAMMGALGIGADISQWADEDRIAAAGRVAIYKSLRHLIADGKLYRLISPTFGPTGTGSQTAVHSDTWAAVEYAAEDGSEAIVFVLGRGTQFGDPTPIIHPRGLDPDSVYVLELVDFHSADEGRLRHMLSQYMIARSGLALETQGFRLWLRGDYASAIVRFRRDPDAISADS